MICSTACKYWYIFDTTVKIVDLLLTCGFVRYYVAEHVTLCNCFL